MGCKACQPVEKNYKVIIKDIARCITQEDLKGLLLHLNFLIKLESKNQIKVIDEKVIELNGYQLNFLAFALVNGSVNSFALISEQLKASIPKMIEIFRGYNMNPLNIACEKNSLEMVKYFLPLYLANKQENKSVIDTIDLSNNGIKEHFDIFTPIQTACLHSSIAVIDYLSNYFNENPSPLFNMRDLNEETGENCALLSVRSGSIQCVQLMHKKYRQDFTVMNRFGETALQVCAVYSSRQGDPSFFEIFCYLIEVVKLDPAINHEEILIVLRDGDIIKYYERVLKEADIHAKKSELDKLNQLSYRDNVIQIVRNEERFIQSIFKRTFGSTIALTWGGSKYSEGSVFGGSEFFKQNKGN